MLSTVRIMLVSLFSIAGTHVDNAETATRYSVEMRVQAGDEMIAAPRLIVTDGDAAGVGQAGDDGVAVGLTVSADGPGTVRVLAEVGTPAGALFPDQIVPLGKWVSISQDRVSLELRVRHF